MPSPAKELVVVEVYSDARGELVYRMITQDADDTPFVHEARVFDVVDPSMPANWALNVAASGAVTIGPRAWAGERFWEDYFDREPDAVRAYWRELRITLARDGRLREYANLKDVAQLRHVQKPYIATLATVRADGSPHAVPVWYRYEHGDFLVLTERSSVKARNIARDPRVELCIDDRERAPFHAVVARGRAAIEPYPGDDWRLALAVHYLGEERGRRYVETTPVSPDEILLRITPEKITGW